MIIIILIHFQLIITNSNGQNQISRSDNYCTPLNPYRLINGECATFAYACYKKNDPQCEEIKNACKNCPPSNITLEVVNLLYEIKNLVLQNNLNTIQNHSQLISNYSKYSNEIINLAQKIKNLVDSKNKTSNSLSISIIVILLILIVLILGIVYFMKRKCRRLESRGGIKNNNIEQTRHLFEPDTSEQEKENQQMLKEIKDSITQLLNKSGGFPSNSESALHSKIDIKFATIQFQFDGIDHEPIELYVHNNHNIVQVKQQICAKLPHAKHNYYKIMKLRYNGIILNDDNQYLLKNIDKSNTIVNCFIDSSMNASDIVVVKLQGKMRLPDILQINKNETIDQLMQLIRNIINSKEFSLFKQSDGSIKTEELKDNLNDLIDGDWIRIITKEFGKLSIKSIFEDEDSIAIEYLNVDLVSSLMTSIKNKFSWDLNNFVLFYKNKCLESRKFIFEYQISSESAVKYCCFMKWAGINIEDDYITKGNFSELRYGTFEKSNRKILIKKYEVKSAKNWKDEEFMMKELITFQITKFQRRFIQLLGVYIDDAILYVVMENMDGGTLKTFLKENYEKLDKNKIYKWSAQILEGLKFLHENKVIHRDLNPSSILVDGNDDLKLSSFNLSKYLDIYKPSSIMAKRYKKEEFPLRYMAPEILNSDKYGEACDVWSFGTVLVRIVTNKKPYSNYNKNEALNQISNLKSIEYKLLVKYSEFKSIIDACLKYDPVQREKIEKLIDNENIGKYIN